MLKTIKYELFIIKQVLKTTVKCIKEDKSLRPIYYILIESGYYRDNDDEIVLGTYYAYLKTIYSR